MAAFCKRCLLRDMDDAAFFASVQAYVDRIPQEQKVPETLYRERLAQCGKCDHLVNGMCALCGCFVEVRAARKNQHCAKEIEIW